MMDSMKAWARKMKADMVAVYLASRDSRVPSGAKVLALIVAAYALSPIDLIPDFVPVIGYLDDLILLPLGIMLVVRLMPADLMAEHRAAALRVLERPTNTIAAIAIGALWTLAIVLSLWGLRRSAPQYFPF